MTTTSTYRATSEILRLIDAGRADELTTSERARVLENRTAARVTENGRRFLVVTERGRLQVTGSQA